MKQAKDLNRLPVRLERELAEDDPQTGAELGRIDLKFLPAMSAREEVYFAFECKRLNATEHGRRRSLAPEYVTEGMMRFVSGQYARSVLHGGMIGYVLDGRGDDAMRLVEQNIVTRSTGLRMNMPARLGPSRLRPDVDNIRETNHDLQPPRGFKLHHLFLECPGHRTGPKNGARAGRNDRPAALHAVETIAEALPIAERHHPKNRPSKRP